MRGQRGVISTELATNFPKPLVNNVWSLNIMTIPGDCLQGRSQNLLTCDSVECVTVDRKTLNELHQNLLRAVDELDSIRLHHEFIVVAQFFVSGIRVRRAEKASLFLDKWLEHSPGQLKEIEIELVEAQRVFQMILAASKTGGA